MELGVLWRLGCRSVVFISSIALRDLLLLSHTNTLHRTLIGRNKLIIMRQEHPAIFMLLCGVLGKSISCKNKLDMYSTLSGVGLKPYLDQCESCSA